MSSNAIKNLKPEILWQRFYEISQVPRPSKKEEKILTHLRKLCNELNVSYKEDAVGNLLLSVPATKGFENKPVVVLQAHVDMVCEKNKSTQHDFDNDPIKLINENGWIKADGTTLGSDNGIGVAAALATITDTSFQHGPLEILLTIDEETGLTGASNLQPGFVSGKMLLNLDSEEDGAFYVGCSGGLDTVGSFNIDAEARNENLKGYMLSISGLKGGHSGLDINTGRANAIKLLARTLSAISENDFYLSAINGGSKRNAIPREAEAEVFCTNATAEEIKKILSREESKFKNEFASADNSVKISFELSDNKPMFVFKKEFTNNLINTLLALPTGVIQMSPDIKELVETSTNLATIQTTEDEVIIGTSQRSSIETANQYIAQSVRSVFELANASVKTGDGYPGWKPNMNSPILATSKKVFKKLFNKEPEIKAIHAGLECGILGDKNPGLDMLSFGPTITGAHSPDEQVNIETVEKFYNLLKAILSDIANSN